VTLDQAYGSLSDPRDTVKEWNGRMTRPFRRAMPRHGTARRSCPPNGGTVVVTAAPLEEGLCQYLARLGWDRYSRTLQDAHQIA
jgi:hypothetical protein